MQQGRIVIITGSPGTGKSTVADKAAMESDMEKSVCIRTDDFFHYLKTVSYTHLTLPTKRIV